MREFGFVFLLDGDTKLAKRQELYVSPLLVGIYPPPTVDAGRG